MRRDKGSPPDVRQAPVVGKLEAGRRIRDVRTRQEGTILDFACQYAHPKAEPVYNYLVRWEDGQVQAISEAAIGGEYGFEVID